jgi:hypothetical protein
VCILNFFARTQHALKKNKMATISLNLQNQFFSQFLSRLPSTHIGFISVQKSKSKISNMGTFKLEDGAGGGGWPGH